MKISYNWLKDYLDFNLDHLEVSRILTDVGLEIEGIEEFQSVKGGLEGLIIGEVKTCKKHPNADKLSITTVDIGKDELLPIVCGAPNVDTGQKVIVAPVGSTLYSDENSFTIKKTKIRGEISAGMICAEDEVGLGDSHEGIMVLNEDAEVGSPVKNYFKVEHDVVYEIGLTPNRIDGASHYGVARDLAAFLNLEKPTRALKPDVSAFKVDNNNRYIDVAIENAEACPRYSGLTLSGIEVKESPEWLKTRLKSIGLSPINNVVDITNFVLHEIGQPLHAFDADKVIGDKIVVKTLDNGTLFTTLDEEKRELSNQDLMICNAKEGMCIAGVFGGIDSGVTEATKNIFLESANFNPVYIRKTSKKHMLFTDSAFRFERGADPEITIYALKRAAMLIKQLAGGEISSDVVDVYPQKILPKKVEVLIDHVNRLAGKAIPLATIKKILESLDIQIIEENKDRLLVEVPAYRVDVTREADVIEEIMRIYGYNNIEFSEKIKSTINHKQKPDVDVLQNIISDILSSNGFHEIMSNSLTKSRYYDQLNTYKPENLVSIYNPLSQDLNAMRQTLLFGGLEAIAYNINRKNANLRLYEFGNCYFYNYPDKKAEHLKGYTEDKQLDLFLTGNRNDKSWSRDEEQSSYYELKAYTEQVMQKLGVDINSLESGACEEDLFDEGISLYINKHNIASLGRVKQSILALLDIEQAVFYANLRWQKIIEITKNHKVEFKPLPRYPSVKRDLALLLDNAITFEQIKKLAFKTENTLLKSVSLFDVYEGKNIEEGKKSYAMSFVLLDETKTLTDKKIDKVMNRLIQTFEKELGAQLR